HGRAGSAVCREHLRLRVERLSPGGARQAGGDVLMGRATREGPTSMTGKRLGVGFVGSGFNARFHLLAFQSVRDADVLGVWSPNHKHAQDMASVARKLDVGEAKPYRSLAEMVADPAIDALWVCGPNFARIDNFEEIADTVARGKGELRGIACEKPLGRNVAEAKRVLDLTKKAGIAHGYLENQAFAPAVAQGRAIIWARGATLTGRPYLARAAEEHSGPHMPWFWQGKLQGGGVLNDMMCHSSLVVRHLLTPLDAPLASVRPARVTGHIASLKWSRPAYAKRLQQQMGKDLVEKQNAEMGLMPVVTSESATYGYDAEDRHFVRVFLGRESPLLTFDDGLEVVKVLMTAYMSAEQGKTLDFPPAGIERFVPAVAKGTWKP